MTTQSHEERARTLVLAIITLTSTHNDWTVRDIEIAVSAIAAAFPALEDEVRRDERAKVLKVTECGIDSDECAHPECDRTKERECIFYRKAMDHVAHALRDAGEKPTICELCRRKKDDCRNSTCVRFGDGKYLIPDSAG